MKWYLERVSSMTGFRRGRGSIDNVMDLVSSVQDAKSNEAEFLHVKGAFENLKHDAILSTVTVIKIAGRLDAQNSDYFQVRLICMSTHDGGASFHLKEESSALLVSISHF